MEKFKELEKQNTFKVEQEKMEKWKKEDLLEKTIQNREGKKEFVFYDGPATANGKPGIHHMVAKLLKDTFCKYKTMQGYHVLRKVGWDTHGLPVEVQVEKELGFNGKEDIEKYGIEKFNQKCRESVWENEDAFKKFTEEMGQFIDLKNPYITYDNNYIETEWWILKQFFDKGLIYDGLKIVPYCPRCGTGLASHEVAQGYKDVSVNTVTVPFKLKEEENTYLLVWTTTPWTLIANVAACVNPKETYVKCKSKGYYFIVAEKLSHKVLGDDFEVVETYKGKDLEYKEYEQLMPFLNVDKKGFYITCADYVTMEDGTGIVHIATAFGQDDYEVGLKYNLPVLNPVDEKGCYTDGPWKGRLVVDPELEVEIIKYLASQDKLFKKQKMVHNYPHCWRCKTPLVYYAKASLYIKTTAFKEDIIKANKKVHWHPSYVGEKRFGNWLSNMNDWAISRNRYWGCPIPLWKCSCGHEEMIGSREELKEKAIEPIDETLDLHRPYVDNIHLTCPKCHQKMQRIPDVIDCWFDSGSMPFAQYHYPFENKELFEKQFPADFISEGVDQTRGWFYSLIVISTFLKGCAPYKNVLVNDLLLDKNGQKMHKSKGNAISPFGVLEKYGADATRFYILSASPVWTPLKFDEDGIKEVNAKFFNTLRNIYTFFQIYANTDQLDPRNFKVAYKDLEEIDQWILSKYHQLIHEVTKAYEEYDLNKVVKFLNNFVNEDFSNWYIRRCRRRFWKGEFDQSKKAVYQTTYEVLLGVCKLLAPVSPFLADEIYVNLTGEESVHLADFPKYQKKYINEEIMEKMDLVRDLISLGRNAREDAKIKVRQPIKEVLVDGNQEAILSNLTSLIEEELNVKNVTFVDDLSEYVDFIVKPNFKEVGKIFGSKMKDFQQALSELSKKEILSLQKGNTISVEIQGETYSVDSSMVDLRMQAKEGFNAGFDQKNIIILNTVLTEDLIKEGIARELVSKIQQLRKNLNFEITDKISISYLSDEMVTEVMQEFEDYIKKETLAEDIRVEKGQEIYDINGHETSLTIVKVNQ